MISQNRRRVKNKKNTLTLKVITKYLYLNYYVERSLTGLSHEQNPTNLNTNGYLYRADFSIYKKVSNNTKFTDNNTLFNKKNPVFVYKYFMTRQDVLCKF